MQLPEKIHSQIEELSNKGNLLAGKEILQEDNPKYFELLKTVLDPPVN